MPRQLEIISTCPESSSVPPAQYSARLRDVGRWCEEAGHSGLIVHSDHRLLDPWAVAQVLLQSTDSIRPIVTVQPAYQHPYATARAVASLALLYERPVDLNLVAGGFRGDLLALDDSTEHDARYRRLVEYGEVVNRLLRSRRPIVYEGDFYRLYRPTTLAPLPAELLPSLFVSGTSRAGREAARHLQARTVGHVATPGDGVVGHAVECVRLGVIARPDSATAWSAARARFAGAPAARMAQRMEMQWTDSRWHGQLTELGETLGADEESPVWLRPFEYGEAQMAYLVGDQRTVARQVLPMLDAGVGTFILDAPTQAEDVRQAAAAFARALARHRSGLVATG